MKALTIIIKILILTVLMLNSCQKSKDEPKENLEVKIPAPVPFFKDNFIIYVNDRFGKEVEKVDADSISGFVILSDKNLPESEFHGKVKQFLIKGTADFFSLVNGLWELDMTIKSEGSSYRIKIKKFEFEHFFKIRFSDFQDQLKYSDFINREHSEEVVNNFVSKFVKIETLTAS